MGHDVRPVMPKQRLDGLQNFRRLLLDPGQLLRRRDNFSGYLQSSQSTRSIRAVSGVLPGIGV